MLIKYLLTIRVITLKILTYAKYDFRPKATNTGRGALAIFETAQAAANAINASPITVKIPLSSISPDEPFPTPTPTESESESDPSSEAAASSQEPVITCTIQTSEHDHNVSIRQNPYHRQFHLSKTWYEVQDLIRSKGERAVPLAQYADCFSRRKGQVPMRIRNMWLEESQKNGAMSLMMLWRRGLEKEQEEEREGTMNEGGSEESAPNDKELNIGGPRVANTRGSGTWKQGRSKTTR